MTCFLMWQLRVQRFLTIVTASLLVGIPWAYAELEPIRFDRVQLECVILREVPLLDEHASVIDTQEAYQSLIAAGQRERRESLTRLHLPNTCANYGYPEIDFSAKTLLGIIEHGSGGCRIIEEELWRDDTHRQYRCHAVVETSHKEFVCTGASWLLVPKMAAGYTVACDVTHRYLDGHP